MPQMCTQLGGKGPQDCQCCRQVIAKHGKADGRPAPHADILRDHVDDDVLLSDGGKHAMADTGLIGHVVQVDPGLIAHKGGAAHDDIVHPLGLGNDPGAFHVAE